MTQSRDLLLLYNIADYLHATLAPEHPVSAALWRLRSLIHAEASGDPYIFELQTKAAASTDSEVLMYRKKSEEQEEMVAYIAHTLEQMASLPPEEMLNANYFAPQEVAASSDAPKERISHYIDIIQAQLRNRGQLIAHLNHRITDLQNNSPQASLNTLMPLQKSFSEVFMAAPQSLAQGQAAQLLAVEKSGLVYIILARSPYDADHASHFHTMSEAFLQHLLYTQKYIGTSAVVEKYLAFWQMMAGVLPKTHQYKAEVAVCLVDSRSGEAEFSSTGIPVYGLAGNILTGYHGGYNPVSHQPASMFSTENQIYKVKNISFQKGHMLVFSSVDPEMIFSTGESSEEFSMGQILLNAQQLSGSPARVAYVNKFLEHAHIARQQAGQLIIAGITF
jgi:hypothetical protein